MSRYFFLLVIILAGFTTRGFGQIPLVYYQVEHNGASPSFAEVGLTGSDISIGSGLIAEPGYGVLQSSSFTTSNTIDLNDYFEFTLMPYGGKEISIVQIYVEFSTTPDGPRNFELRSSLDDYSSVHQVANLTYYGEYFCAFQFNPSDVNFTSATTFRIYGYDAVTASGIGGPAGIYIDGTTRDVTTGIYPPDIQIPASSISSLSNDYYSPISVFKFRIQDWGPDGFNTWVTKIKLIPGATNTASWASVIQGVMVDDEYGGMMEFWPTIITNDSIVIPTYGSLVAYDYGISEYTIRVSLNTSGITDNQILSFQIPQNDHGFTTEPWGSGFLSSFSGPVSSNDHTITVSGTNLKFASQPSTVNLNENFSVTVEATDINGNRDLDASHPVTLSRAGGNGTLSSGSSLTKSLSSGIATWDDLQYNVQQQFEISASATGYTAGLASNISFTTPLNAADLIISEYVEGSANNKYIEIYNGTGSSVDLSGYSLRLFPDGGTSADPSVQLSGTLPSGHTRVYKNSSASLTLPDGVTADDNSAVNFDGNDAFALFKNESMVDLIGNIGENPGAAWTSNSYSTAGKTLRRKSSVSRGIESDPASGFPTLATEWELYNEDDVAGLGSHTYDASSVIGEETIASGSGGYEFQDRFLSLFFESAGSGGSLNVAFFQSAPQDISGITSSNISPYRWVINNNGVSNFNATFRVPRSEALNIPSTGNDVVKLYKRPTPGTGVFDDLGYMQYDGVNDEFYMTGITSFSEFALGSEAPLPVELTSFAAKAHGTTVNLMWETKTEIDNNGFEVERNSHGLWQKIGFVEGHGTANSPKFYNFTDKNVTGNKINYRLKQIDNTGTFEYSQVVEVELNPVQFALYQNYPNPFNPSTVIRYALPVAGVVTIDVFNTLGEKVTTLLNGQVEAGYHEVSFDAAALPGGVYFYKITSGNFTSVKKLLLLK